PPARYPPAPPATDAAASTSRPESAAGNGERTTPTAAKIMNPAKITTRDAARRVTKISQQDHSSGKSGVSMATHRGTRPARRDETGNPSHPQQAARHVSHTRHPHPRAELTSSTSRVRRRFGSGL